MTTRNIVLGGLLIALAVVLGTLPAVRIALMGSYNLKVSFMVVPCILAGLLMGPLYGFAVGFLADLITTLLVPTGGGYLPIFSVIMGMMGMGPALLCGPVSKLFRTGKHAFRVLFPCVLLSQFLFSTLANTAVLAWLMLGEDGQSFGSVFAGLVVGRSISLALTPMHAFLCGALVRLYRKVAPPASS